MGLLKASAASLGLLLALPAAASEEDYAGLGIGTTTCAEFEQSLKADQRAEKEFLRWTQGYLTGRNLARMEAHLPTMNLATVSTEDQMRFLREYCDANPRAHYYTGIMRLEEKFELSRAESQ